MTCVNGYGHSVDVEWRHIDTNSKSAAEYDILKGQGAEQITDFDRRIELAIWIALSMEFKTLFLTAMSITYLLCSMWLDGGQNFCYLQSTLDIF